MQHLKYATLLTLMISLAAAFPAVAQSAKSHARTDTARQDGVQVSGVVTDGSTGAPLSGVNVEVPGFSAAITNDKGRFRIRVPSRSSTVIVSGEGFQRKEVALKGSRHVQVRLYQMPFPSFYSEATLPLGSGSVSMSPYDVSTLSLSDKWGQKAGESADDYLQGRVAGLNVIRRSGTPGIGAWVSLRGFNSLFGTNQPLYVVDGMIYDNNTYGSSLIGGHVENPLSDIDLKDIDHITVIRDGTSTYGTRGANGVILITTARAKELATRIDFATYGGFNMTPAVLPVMDAAHYRVYLADLLQTAGYLADSINSRPYMNDAKNPDYYNYHHNTSWQNQVMKNSYNQNYYLKVTGGDNIATYALSLGYLKDAGILEHTDLTRSQTRFNADLNLAPKFKAAVNLSFTSNQQQLTDQSPGTQTNPLYLSQIKAPFLGVHVISPEGIPSPNLSDYDIFNVSNPVAIIDNMQAQNKNYRFFGSARFRYIFSDALSLQTLIGVTFDKVKEDIFIPDAGVVSDTLVKAVARNESGSRIQRLYSLYNDTHLSYDHTFGAIHHVSASLGFRYNSSRSEEERGTDFKSATDEFVSVGMGDAALRTISGGLGQWNWMNNYLNVNYGLLSRYFLSANLAVDGSSRFGKQAPDGVGFAGARFAVNPSVAAAWLISSESFMSPVHFLELLKLRASYTSTGNDDIGNYSAREYYVAQNLLGMQGLVRGSIGNPALEWETVHKADIGLDASLFHERLSLSLDWFSNNTRHMVTPDSLSTVTGMKAILVNGAAMKTTGFDAMIRARLVNRGLKWDLGLNLGVYRNRITELPSGRMLQSFAGATYLTEKGHAANLFYGYKTDGIFASDAQAQSSGLMNVKSDGSLAPFHGGDIRFVDENGDHVIDARDEQIIGNPNPSLTGGITNALSWKNWSLEALFSYSLGGDIYDYNRAQLEAMSGQENGSRAVENRWRADGQQTTMPRAAWGDPSGNARFSDRWIDDGSYLRLSTLSLSWSVPVKTATLQYIRIYATGNNLLTLTKYLGYDPEFDATSSLFGQGVDLGLEPQFRSVQLGIRLGF
jgi:TonB-linked SusC/RagA family outer membrane protein